MPKGYEHLGMLGLTVVGAIIGAVVVVTLISALLPTFAGAAKNISANVSTVDWGNSTTNSIAPVFGLVISLAALFALVGLIFLGLHLHKSGKI
jgi:hypothetical protein